MVQGRSRAQGLHPGGGGVSGKLIKAARFLGVPTIAIRRPGPEAEQ